MDAHKNFAYGIVATAPSPATSGASLVLQAGQGLLLPAAPFNATVWHAGVQPLSTNAEIVRVTVVASNTVTMTRAQEGSTARAITIGDQFAAGITAKMFTDIEGAASAPMSYTFSSMTGTDAPGAGAAIGTPDDIAGTYGWCDFTGYTQAQFVANVLTGWSAGATCRPQYSTDSGATWNYFENSGSGFALPVNTVTAQTSTLQRSAAYVVLASTAQAPVDVRLVIYGNGAGVMAGRLRGAWLITKP